MRKAFDSDDYQVMLASSRLALTNRNCVPCTWTWRCGMRTDLITPEPHLSRESGTFVLDFFNDPEDILASLTIKPQNWLMYRIRIRLVWKVESQQDFSVDGSWTEAFFTKNKSNAAISNICRLNAGRNAIAKPSKPITPYAGTLQENQWCGADC